MIVHFQKKLANEAWKYSISAFIQKRPTSLVGALSNTKNHLYKKAYLVKLNNYSKKTLIGALMLMAGLSFGAMAWAQSGAANGQAGAAAQSQQKFVKVSSLNSVQANQEFQRNVQLVRTQRQQLVQLNAALEKETNAENRAKLQKASAQLLSKLEENNKKMVETYGFSLNRNYTMVVEQAHIYMFVSDEEAAKIEAMQKQQAQ